MTFGVHLDSVSCLRDSIYDTLNVRPSFNSVNVITLIHRLVDILVHQTLESRVEGP